MRETNDARINFKIRAKELRVIGPTGENFGILPFEEAIKRAEEFGMDLIEISPNATPPIAKIGDSGKYQYEQNKKQKAAKSKSHSVEVKNLQIKIGTGEHDLMLKAKKASEWLSEGNKVKIDLYVVGRAKFMEFNFLKERLDRILKLITVAFKAEEPKKGPKGLSTVVEKSK